MAASCVTLIVCAVTPVPLTVSVAVRLDVVIFCAAVTVIVSLSFPEAGEIVSHEALLLTAHSVLEETTNVFCSTESAKLSEVGEMDKTGAPASCVTLIVCAVTPAPLTVMVAVRFDVVVFCAAVTVIVSLSKPEAGEIVSHDALLETVQSVLEVIAKVFCSPEKAKFNESDEMDRVSGTASCVTLIGYTEMLSIEGVRG